MSSFVMMEPPVTSKVLRAPSLKRGQENVRIQDRVSKIEIFIHRSYDIYICVDDYEKNIFEINHYFSYLSWTKNS